MADILKTSIAVQFTEEEIQKTSRFLDEQVSHEPISHEQGRATLTGGLSDYQLISNVNQVVLFVEDAGTITIKVGNTTATPFTHMRMFVYDGDTTDVFVSNSGVDSVKVTYVSGKF